MTQPYQRPFPHPSGARPPAFPAEAMPRHIAIVMDGNGRWANARGLPRTKGHEAGEASLLDVVALPSMVSLADSGRLTMIVAGAALVATASAFGMSTLACPITVPPWQPLQP